MNREELKEVSRLVDAVKRYDWDLFHLASRPALTVSVYRHASNFTLELPADLWQNALIAAREKAKDRLTELEYVDD